MVELYILFTFVLNSHIHNYYIFKVTQTAVVSAWSSEATEATLLLWGEARSKLLT